MPKVKGHHPVMEAVGKKLFGIGGVPAREQDRMVTRACRLAVDMYEQQREEIYVELMDLVHTAEGWSDLDLAVGRAYVDLIKGLADKYAPEETNE